VIHRGPAVQQIVPPAGVAIDASTVDATGDISTEGDLKVEVTSGGIYTITGTDTATNRTLTLPDEAGTVLTSGTDVANFPSGFANGITEADQWRISTNNSYSSGLTVVSTNWERNDTDFQLIGSGMTESSGVFTFPSTGIYLIISISGSLSANGSQNFVGHNISVSTDGGSNWSARAQGWGDAIGTNAYQSVTLSTIIDVSSTANVKLRMMASVAANTTFEGASTNQTTGITFLRIGDT